MLSEHVPASQRPDPGLRMELRRREPAGPRLGDAVRLQHRRSEPGEGDRDCLERAFQKLLLNFTWWVNRKDRAGNNVFEGGFLGLDNIGVFDRSAPLPTGGTWSRPTAPPGWRCSARTCWRSPWSWRGTTRLRGPWLRKFVEHFLWIASAMDRVGDNAMTSCGTRRMASSTTCCACPTGAPAPEGPVDGRPAAAVRDHRRRSGGAARAISSGVDAHRLRSSSTARDLRPASTTRRSRGVNGRLLALRSSTRTKLRRILAADARRGASSSARTASGRCRAGTRTIRTCWTCGGEDYAVKYLPAESDTGMFGGNSNWRGPIWMPVNVLIIRALLQFYLVLRRRLHDRMPDRARAGR